MMDDRTPEQRNADRALEEAIDASAKAYGEEGLLIEWVVVAAHHLDDGNDTFTSVNWTVSDGLPIYRLMGLINFAGRQIAATADDGGDGE